ncbi:hypothetical protein [Streptomyces sp. N35]|uniref:hypothetical protein n=1 Tax=Streptomyces sp. N35 TaxID=2795730 RepID=UPI0018F59D20|nr:hypothetical protein [Streptomyces sp. N35]
MNTHAFSDHLSPAQVDQLRATLTHEIVGTNAQPTPLAQDALAFQELRRITKMARPAVNDELLEDDSPGTLIRYVRHLVATDTHRGLRYFRAGHRESGIPLERYTTAAEARRHCEAVVRREHPHAQLTMRWHETREPDEHTLDAERLYDAELTVTLHGQQPPDCHTGYAVTEIEIATLYDPEADE